VAAATRVGGARVLRVSRGLDLQPASPGEEQAVARHARGQHAVEQVDAGEHAAEEVLRRADAHEVPRLVRRQELRRVRYAVPRLARVLADREAAQGVAGEIESSDLGRVALAQVALQASLDDAEQRAARLLLPL